MRSIRYILPSAAAALLLALPSPVEAQHEGHGAQLSCMAPRGNVAERPSPYDSLSTMVGNAMVKVCYGRPSANGRQLVGHDLHPFGQPWRFGANEATQLHTTAPLTIAGVRVGAGSYSIYTVPGADQWEVVVNGNAQRWGIPINAEVMAQNVGSGTVPAETLAAPVETLTFSFDVTATGDAHLVAEWERWRIRIPIRPAAD